MSRSSRSRRGAGAVEFALAAPIVLAFVLAIIDLSRYVANVHRVTSAASAVADLGAQIERFTAETDPEKVTTGRELAVLAVAGREVARPLPLLRQGALVVTVVSNSNGTLTSWSERWGRDDIASRVSATSLQGLELKSGEGAVFAEVGYGFRPFVLSGKLFGLDDEWTVRSLAVRRPRLAGPERAP